jgi:hypothetical protein
MTGMCAVEDQSVPCVLDTKLTDVHGIVARLAERFRELGRESVVDEELQSALRTKSW